MKIIKKETLWEGNFLRIVLITFIDRDGHTRKWEAVERKNSKGIVIVIPITSAGEFVFIRQFRPAFGGYVIEFPAGLNDKKEALIEVARRELIEETGLICDDILFLAEGPVSSGLSTEVNNCLCSQKCKRSSRRLTEKISSRRIRTYRSA